MSRQRKLWICWQPDMTPSGPTIGSTGKAYLPSLKLRLECCNSRPCQDREVQDVPAGGPSQQQR